MVTRRKPHRGAFCEQLFHETADPLAIGYPPFNACQNSVVQLFMAKLHTFGEPLPSSKTFRHVRQNGEEVYRGHGPKLEAEQELWVDL
jgi:hypothetical protein